MLTPEELSQKIDSLQEEIQKSREAAETSPDAEEQKALKSKVDELGSELQTLSKEREERVRADEIEDMKAQIGTLESALSELRKPTGHKFAGGVPTKQGGKSADDPYAEGGSFYLDILSANRGNQKALDRIARSHGDADVSEVKAMVEGTDAAGGYLVPPQRLNEILELREASAKLRPLFSKVQVRSDSVEIASVTSGMTAGWVAELAAKPSADLAFSQITASVFTVAGLGIVSNQLLKDASRIDSLINAELAKRIAKVEDVAYLLGTGTAQPRGIINTTGINTVTLGTWSATAFEDAVIDADYLVQEDIDDAADTIVMHPRRWAKILKLRDVDGRRLTADNILEGSPTPRLNGKRVVLSTSVPVNRGAGTNQDLIVVGKFSEGLILDREGITVDQSPHVYFTTNQTVFRAEARTGFTAARYPGAFCAIEGAGLVP